MNKQRIRAHVSSTQRMLVLVKEELKSAFNSATVAGLSEEAEKLSDALAHITAALDSLRVSSTGPITTIDLPVAPTPAPRITIPTPSTPASESEPSKE